MMLVHTFWVRPVSLSATGKPEYKTVFAHFTHRSRSQQGPFEYGVLIRYLTEVFSVPNF